MTHLRDRIESRLAAVGHWLYRHPWLALASVAVATGLAFSQLPRVYFDTSNESFFRKDDTSLEEYDAFREQFGREEYVIIGISPPEVFDRAFLEKLGAFHEALETDVPFVKDVTSLINVRDTRGEGDELIVEDLLETLPETPEAMAALKQRVLASELYPNYLISADGRFTVVLMETLAFSPEEESDNPLAGFGVAALPGAEPAAGAATAPAGPAVKRTPLQPEQEQALVAAVHKVAARFDGPDFPLHVAGNPVLNVFFDHAMSSDMGRFSMLAVATIGVLLLFLFRRLSGVVLPLLVVILSLLTTIGLMAATGTPLTLPTTILPSFLLAVCVGSAVHLLAIFFRRYRQDGDKEASIAHALGTSGLPIAMTGLTTAAGLFSFSTSEMAPVAHLGIFGGSGVLISLVYTLVMVPALLALWPLRQFPRFGGSTGGARSDRLLIAVADLATGRPWSIVAVSAALLLAAVVGLTQLRFSMNFVEWIPRTQEIRQNIDRIDRELKGSSSLEVVVNGGAPSRLYEPALMQGIDGVAAYAEAYRHPRLGQLVAKTNSVADVLKETHRALNENRKAFYVLPEQRDLIAQELLLFEGSGSDDLETLVDTQFSKARLSIMVPWADAATYVEFVDDVRQRAQHLEREGAQVVVTGTLNLWTQMIYNMMRSMVRSYLIAGVVITIMMMLLISSLRIGTVSMVVNFAPIMITMGVVMGFWGIPLDAFTLLIGSIALGLAVDDTIHFFHHFRRAYGESGDVRQAVRETLLTAGRAMLFTSAVLVLGFWLFMFATLNNVFYFGLLTGIALIFALLSDFLLAPAIMTLITRTEYGREVSLRWGRRAEA